jgi:hypothetical protein
MYARDCNAIADHAIASPHGLFDVIEFTLCTIQMGLSTVKQQRRDIAARGADSAFLFGSKRDGWRYARDNIASLWGEAIALRECGTNDAETVTDAVLLFMRVPGLGMVKASFVAQMLGFNVACLDTHNLRRLGLPVSAMKISATLKPDTMRRKVSAYVALCQQEGAEYWWDTWCNYVAGNKSNRMLDTGDVVSKYHWDAVSME